MTTGVAKCCHVAPWRNLAQPPPQCFAVFSRRAMTGPLSKPPAKPVLPADVSSRSGERPPDGPFPCPNCGAEMLMFLGETRYSTVLRCGACSEVTVRRRQ